jgi:hypothetical protein
MLLEVGEHLVVRRILLLDLHRLAQPAAGQTLLDEQRSLRFDRSAEFAELVFQLDDAGDLILNLQLLQVLAVEVVANLLFVFVERFLVSGRPHFGDEQFRVDHLLQGLLHVVLLRAVYLALAFFGRESFELLVVLNRVVERPVDHGQHLAGLQTFGADAGDDLGRIVRRVGR